MFTNLWQTRAPLTVLSWSAAPQLRPQALALRGTLLRMLRQLPGEEGVVHLPRGSTTTSRCGEQFSKVDLVDRDGYMT